MQLIPTLALLALLGSFANAADLIGAAKVTADMDRDRLARLLHVNQAEINVEAERPFTSASVRLDFYRDGKKVDTFVAASKGGSTPQHSATVSLQTADLDVLKLSNGKHGSVRFNVDLTTSGDGLRTHAAQEHDVSKDVCSLSEWSGASWWSSGEFHDDALPLFWMLKDRHSDTHQVISGKSPDALVKSNPTADIVIVSIQLTDEAATDGVASAAQ